MPNALQPRFIALFFLGLFALLPLHAQKVEWSPNGGELPLNVVAELSLVFTDCDAKGQPSLPKTPGLTLQYGGRSEQISWSNFSSQKKTVSFNYAARLDSKKAVTIPAFEIETDKGPIKVPAARFEPGESGISVGKSQVPVDKIASSQLTLRDSSFWAGEVFPLTYRLYVNSDYGAQLASHPDWTPDPVIAEKWGKEKILRAQGGDLHVRVEYQARGYIKSPGSHELNPVTQLINVQTGGGGPFNMFPQTEQLAITSDKPRINIRPLPSPAPIGFSGAVGQFKLESKIVPDKAAVGEPITWTLTVSGIGNWPDFDGLPAREVSKAFQVIQPQSKRTMDEGSLFSGRISEDVVLMPTQPGTFTLGEVRLVVFDPQSGTYRTLTTPKTSITVTTPAPTTQPSFTMGTPAAPQNVGPSPSPTTALTAPLPNTQPPPPPAAIPGDPLSPASAASAPFGQGGLCALLAAPFFGVLCFWLFLSYKRARLLDPLASRRAAHSRIHATLAQLTRLARIDTAATPALPASVSADTSATARHRLLAAWQHDTALLWNADSAAPTSDMLLHAAPIPGSLSAKSTLSPSPVAEQTAKLWTEADSTLYGPSTPLSVDWVDRALQVWSQTKPASFSPWALFKPRFCMPWFFSLVLLCAFFCPASTSASTLNDTHAKSGNVSPVATSPEAFFRRGDFVNAQKGWETQLKNNPLDWSTRANLGLALLQKGEPGAAVAHLAVAWVQQPRDPEVQRAFHLALSRVDTAPAVLGPLQRSSPLNALVRLASPREWQYVLVAAAALLAAALAILLRTAFVKHRRFALRTAAVCFIAATAIGTASLLALRTYGDAANRKAVLVWSNSHLRSIPTEVDTAQETTTLPAGTLAVADRSFLGWIRLKFPSGQSGWARSEDVVRLWE